MHTHTHTRVNGNAMLIHLSILTIYNQFIMLISCLKHKFLQIVCCGVEAMVVAGAKSMSGHGMCHPAHPVKCANIVSCRMQQEDSAGGVGRYLPCLCCIAFAWRSEAEKGYLGSMKPCGTSCSHISTDDQYTGGWVGGGGGVCYRWKIQQAAHYILNDTIVPSLV